MSVESTTKVMNDYLDALLKQEDFGRFFADDILWTTTETGDEVRGRDAVRDFIVAFHTQVFEARPEFTGLTVGDGRATLEANFVGTHTGDFAGIAPYRSGAEGAVRRLLRRRRRRDHGVAGVPAHQPHGGPGQFRSG